MFDRLCFKLIGWVNRHDPLLASALLGLPVTLDDIRP